MSEIQDLLNASTQAMVDDYLIVDDNSREIYIPSGEILFGVTSDEKTERKYFQCPRIVGDNVDLTKYQLYINYQNANGEKDVYEITDVKTQDDTITFSWLLSRKVTEYQGTISFIICARNVNDSGVITNEWNTAIANGTCLIGLEASKQIAQENYDILEDVLKRLRLIEETGTSVDLSAYQKKTDEELKTTNKTIVGAINEIKDNQKNLPIATSELLGGVKPVSKTSEMTKEVGIDENGKLFVKEDITQEEITQLKNKSDFSGKWDDLEGKPTIPDAVTVDTTLSFTSTNPVQNKVITTELNKKLSTIPTATSTTLGGVKPTTKTSSMTQEVGVDSNGRLWTKPDESDGSSITIPVANTDTLGGVKPVEKTSNMTQSVGVDSNGALFTLNKYAMPMELLFEETAQGVLLANFDISAINLEKKGKLWVDIELVGDATLDDDIFSSLNKASVNVAMFENYIYYFDAIRITKAYSTGHVSFIIEYDFDTPVAYVYGTNGIFSLQRRYSPLTGYDYRVKLLYGVNMRNTGELNVRLNVEDSENASKALKSINVKIYKL